MCFQVCFKPDRYSRIEMYIINNESLMVQLNVNKYINNQLLMISLIKIIKRLFSKLTSPIYRKEKKKCSKYFCERTHVLFCISLALNMNLS